MALERYSWSLSEIWIVLDRMQRKCYRDQLNSFVQFREGFSIVGRSKALRSYEKECFINIDGYNDFARYTEEIIVIENFYDNLRIKHSYVPGINYSYMGLERDEHTSVGSRQDRPTKIIQITSSLDNHKEDNFDT
jgi:hypothetical protein